MSSTMSRADELIRHNGLEPDTEGAFCWYDKVVCIIKEQEDLEQRLRQSYKNALQHIAARDVHITELVAAAAIADNFANMRVKRIRRMSNIIRKLEWALKVLVSLKDFKDEHGKTAKYLDQQPRAWEDARRVLRKEEGL